MTPGLEPAPLERWLSDRLPGAHAPFEYRLIAGGHSNITYRVEDASGSRFVLRRPPLGAQPQGAHDVAREYRIQAALRPTNVPVPYVGTFMRRHERYRGALLRDALGRWHGGRFAIMRGCDLADGALTQAGRR